MLRANWLLLSVLMTMPISAKAQPPLVVPSVGTLSFLHPNDVVLFQGDSITDGGRWRTGSDYNHIMGQDYAYILAGEIGATYADRNLSFVNRGIGGERTVDLAARWKADTLDLKPNVLSLLIGINDLLAPGDKAIAPEMYEATYDKLLADTLAALPQVKIVLGEPFMLPVGLYAADYAARRAALQKRQDIVAKLAAKYHLPMVQYQAVFDAACKRAPAERWSWDGIHPTYAGHWLMAQEWLRVTDAAWGSGVTP